ncbi:MAG: ABC transporter substrate-binding protein, partial [Bacteroidia bacterium]|nr:ABC transporter substrate-binding protein [Bacteroidia bacterium]
DVYKRQPQGVLTLFPPLPPDLSEKELIALFQGAMGYPIRVFSASAHSWEEYEQLIHRLGEALPAQKKALRWLDHVRKRKERLLTRSRTIQHRQTIACLQPNGLPQLIGEWADILADFAGLSPLSAQTKTLPWEDLLKADPDIVVITLQGKNLSTTGEAVAAWARLPQVQGLSAFRKKKLYALQGTTGIFYPSPYTIYTAEALYELAYTPTYRYNRHIGRIWAPLL